MEGCPHLRQKQEKTKRQEKSRELLQWFLPVGAEVSESARASEDLLSPYSLVHADFTVAFSWWVFYPHLPMDL